MGRWLKFIVVVVMAAFAVGLAGVAVASAEPYKGKGSYFEEPSPGEKVLRDAETHEIVKKPDGTDARWSPGEWEAQKKELETTGECVTRINNCVNDILHKRTGLQYATPGEANAGETIVADARAAGTSLDPAVTQGLDFTAEAGGTLDLGLASTALGVVALGPAAFELGMEIGKGPLGEDIQQLFGLPTFSESGSEEEISKESPTCHVVHRPEAQVIAKSGETPAYTLPSGYYDACNSHDGFLLHQYCVGGKPKCLAGWAVDWVFPVPGAFDKRIRVTSFVQNRGEEGTITEEEELAYRVPECEVDPEQFEEGCVPLGLPSVGPLSSEQQGVNTEHGLPARPEERKAIKPITSPRPRPVLTPEMIEPILKCMDCIKYIEEKGGKTPKQLHEEEEEEKVIPMFERGETGPAYVSVAESNGFTNVHENILPESAIDPTVARNVVSKVAPSPGTKAEPGHYIQVDVNPSDAPAPGIPEEGGGIGPPTLPGLHPPSLHLLCTTMPFGVPCWLISQLEQFAGAQTTPEWTIGPIEFAGNKIPAAKISLAVLEPVMSIVRPFMVIFSTVGILLLFYKIFTGKSMRGGENPSGDVPEPDSEE